MDSRPVSHADVKNAADRIEGLVRPVAMAQAAPDVWFALEFLQHTGTFKARGASNFLAAHRDAGEVPAAGVVIASGGNAGLACAWAAREHGVPAHVFLPRTAPAVKADRLRGYGADVRLEGATYQEALDASRRYAEETGALQSHAYDHPLISAGAGTLLLEIADAAPVDTVVVSVGGGGLFSGMAAAADSLGIRMVAVEPENCRALNAELTAGHVVDSPVDSVAADSLGATRVSQDALWWIQQPGNRSVLVADDQIVAVRRKLWAEHRLAVEHAAATALAALEYGVYRPEPGERVAVVLCGANTDPSDLVTGPRA
ncbi:serine/threonine dehydratase [Streptomyces sp. NPDC051940]|uniref:serine/threonine dehydratase n=1 Tax=Streptomyces sp. NPDC051940 TaxID=3155675 RepID=UPI0034457E2E